MTSTKRIVEQTRDVAEALARAMGTSFDREVTAYLTDAFFSGRLLCRRGSSSRAS